MNRAKIINIAEDFSRCPGPRLISNGPHSAEEFREEILIPALNEAYNNYSYVIVILDGTAGLCASFLDEAFGRLFELYDFPEWFIDNHLLFVSDEDPRYIDEINEYIEEKRN